MERSGDVAGLLDALDDPGVTKSSRRLGAVILGLRRLEVFDAAPKISPFLTPDHPESVRRSAARALGPLQNPAAIPALRTALAGSPHKVQIWAIRSLGELRDRGSLDRLVGRLGDSDWVIRANAARALGEIGDQDATEALVSRLPDARRTVRLSVIDALVSLRDPRALSKLEEMAASDKSFRGRPYKDGARRLRELL
jgi:HEAT repeat protein